MKRITIVFFTLIFISVVISCATFYELNYEFNQQFESGNIQAAEEALAKNKRKLKKKTRFLYLANRGVLDAMQGDYEESNEWLEKAYLYTEDYQKNYANIAASFLINPNLIEYPGEDHERLFILYYKALNYLKMGRYQEALVECRRLNNRLYELSDKYKSEKKYQEDAFIHNLMGIIYEASGDYNNAFIAYRNSHTIYEDQYSKMFGLSTPHQLKKDLLRAAYLTGFDDQVRRFENEFNMKYDHKDHDSGELVFFWHDGLAPVKDEWSINFTIVGNGGVVTFVNKEHGLNFSFPYDSDEKKNELTDLRFFRVAFPKYVERPLTFNEASIRLDQKKFPLEKAEDVNAIAFKTLNQRMVLEMGKSLLRAALKKIAEEEIRKESEGIGLLVGVINATTEKADTRSWQTLPHSIYYTRVPLDKGSNEIKLNLSRKNSQFGQTETFSFEGIPGKTQFHTYHTLH